MAQEILRRLPAVLLRELSLHVPYLVRGLELEGDRVEALRPGGHGLQPVQGPLLFLNARQDRDVDAVAPPAQAQDQVERGLLLYVVVGQGAAGLQLLAREDEPLLVRRDALLV